jgi:hypothetical protein
VDYDINRELYVDDEPDINMDRHNIVKHADSNADTDANADANCNAKFHPVTDNNADINKYVLIHAYEY